MTIYVNKEWVSSTSAIHIPTKFSAERSHTQSNGDGSDIVSEVAVRELALMHDS